MIHSIRARLTLWHALTLAAFLIVFAAGTWLFIGRTLRAGAGATTANMAAELEKSWTEDIAEEGSQPVAAVRAAIEEYRDHDTRLRVYDGAGALIAVSDSSPLGPGSMLTRERRVRVAGAPYTIVAARSLAAEDATIASFTRALAFAVSLALLVTALGGYLLARATLAPVVTMGRQATHIGSSNLNERLPVANPRDELGMLALAFNGLLARLDEAFQSQRRAMEQQRQFMADASHELRTPVTALRTTADVALADTSDAAPLRDALTVVQGEARRLARIVDDLFLLARADAGQLALKSDRVYLDDVVQDAVRAARALAVTRGVRLNIGNVAETPIAGDPDLLRRAVMILLDNAIKYVARGGSVRAGVRSNGSGAKAIVVEDSGSGVGIPTADRERIFERFVRLDEARTRDEAGNAGGAGLGLAIARWIAEAHGGSVRVEESGPAGSRFALVLPSSELASVTTPGSRG